MARQLDDLVRQWATLGAGADRPKLERAMAEVARPLAVRAARSHKLPTADAEDVAQEACARLLKFVARGARFDINPEGWVWRVASNLALDVLRKQTRQRKRLERLHRDAQASAGDSRSPEAFWEDEERRAKLEQLVRPLLDKAPENYRVALQRHWYDGVAIEKLAAERLSNMAAAGEFDPSDPVAVAQAQHKARNVIDQHLKRGRDWLRKRLEDKIDEGEL